MRLPRQLQARFFFYKKMLSVKKHQNGKQIIFALLEVFVRAKNVALVV